MSKVVVNETKGSRLLLGGRRGLLLRPGIVLAVLAVSFFFGTVSVSALKRAEVGKPAPAFNLSTLDKGQLKLGDFSGKVVAVCFWKFGKKSEAELEFLQRAYLKYKDKNLEILAVYIPETDNDVPAAEIQELEKLISEKGLSFPVLIDKGLKVFNEYGVITMPTLLLVDKSGKLITDYPGFPRFTGEKQLTRHIESALGIAKKVVKKKKKTYKPKGKAGFHYKFGLRFFNLGFLGKSEEKLTKALAEDPDYPAAHILLAKVYTIQKKKDKAINEFNLAIAADPENIKVHVEYGKFAIDNKLYDEALAEYETVKVLKPASGAGDLGLAQLYLAQKKYGEAIKAFKAAINLYTGKKSGKGDLFSMRTAAKAEKKGNPALGPAYYGLALAQMEQGKKDEALTSFQKAIKNFQKTIEQIRLELTTAEEQP